MPQRRVGGLRGAARSRSGQGADRAFRDRGGGRWLDLLRRSDGRPGLMPQALAASSPIRASSPRAPKGVRRGRWPRPRPAGRGTRPRRPRAVPGRRDRLPRAGDEVRERSDGLQRIGGFGSWSWSPRRPQFRRGPGREAASARKGLIARPPTRPGRSSTRLARAILPGSELGRRRHARFRRRPGDRPGRRGPGRGDLPGPRGGPRPAPRPVLVPVRRRHDGTPDQHAAVRRGAPRPVVAPGLERPARDGRSVRRR